jgi:hypothetical protein
MESGIFVKSNNLKGLMFFSVYFCLPIHKNHHSSTDIAQKVGLWIKLFNYPLHFVRPKYTSIQTTSKKMKNTYNFRLLRGQKSLVMRL